MEMDQNKLLNELLIILQNKTGVSIDPKANFLEIGGNSIVAAQIIAEINEYYKIELPITKLLETETIQGFLDLVIQEVMTRKETKAVITDVVQNSETSRNKWPLASDQERIWFLDQINPGNPAFNIYSALRVKGKLNLDILNQSFQLLLKKHELFRARFVYEDNKIFQFIQDYEARPVPVEKISESALQESLKAESAKGMNVAEGNLLKIKVFTIAENDSLIFLNIHHIIADAWSIGIVISDLLSNYAALSGGQQISIDNTANYLDFIRYQQEVIEKNQEAQMKFWKESLDQVPTRISLPYDFERPTVVTYQAGQIRFELDQNLIQAIRKVTVDAKVTVFNFLYSAFSCLLFVVSGQKEFLVGCPIANRKQTRFNSMIGFFTNTLVMKNQFTDSLDLQTFMKQNNDFSNLAFNHSDIPFMKIVQNIVHSREYNVNPLFQVMFSMLQIPENPKMEGLTVELMDTFSGYSDYDIFLTLEVNSKAIKGAFTYSQDVFEEKTAKALVQEFTSIMEQMVRNIRLKTSEFVVHKELLEIIQMNKNNLNKQQVVVASNFSDQPLQSILAFWMKKLKIPSEIHLADYNQIFNQLLDPTQLMSTNKNGVNIILIRIEDWLRYQQQDKQTLNTVDKISSICDDFIRALKNAVERFSVPVIISILPSNGSDRTIPADKIEALTQTIQDSVLHLKHCYLLKYEELITTYPVPVVFDPVTDSEGHLPFTSDFYKVIGTSLARKIHTLKRKPYKVAILDCDNTLWKGVLGEDGYENIEVDAARKEFHQFLIEEQKSGMLLCLVSKNEESDVIEALQKNNNVLIKQEHLTLIKANWDSKPNNILKIAEELNLGLDSFIFLDDNPVECAEVTASLPEVLTIQFPQEPADIQNLMKHGWFWDHLAITEEDRNRTLMYKQDMERKQSFETHLSFEEFYQSLALTIAFDTVKPEDVERVSQLTQRTNQFNTTTKRRTEKEITDFIATDTNQCVTVRVSDRFGNYGLVGVLFYQKTGGKMLLESLLLSCRTLGKGVEHKIMNYLASKALEQGIQEIHVSFISSPKNTPAFNFLKSIPLLRQENNGSVELYVYSTDVLKDLRFDPSQHRIESAAETKAPVVAKTHYANNNALLLELLNNFNKVESIVIETQTSQKTVGTNSLPENEVQEKIVQIVKEVLAIQSIGIDDNFFDLGGYSLQLVQLLSRFQQEFNKTLHITDLFQYTNIRKLSQYFSNGETGSALKSVKERGEQQRKLILSMRK